MRKLILAGCALSCISFASARADQPMVPDYPAPVFVKRLSDDPARVARVYFEDMHTSVLPPRVEPDGKTARTAAFLVGPDLKTITICHLLMTRDDGGWRVINEGCDQAPGEKH